MIKLLERDEEQQLRQTINNVCAKLEACEYVLNLFSQELKIVKVAEQKRISAKQSNKKFYKVLKDFFFEQINEVLEIKKELTNEYCDLIVDLDNISKEKSSGKKND